MPRRGQLIARQSENANAARRGRLSRCRTITRGRHLEPQNDSLLELLLIGVVLLFLGLWLVKRAFRVALNLLAWASDQGFLGVAAYLACWIFLFPVMLAVCFIGALSVSSGAEPSEEIKRPPPKPRPTYPYEDPLDAALRRQREKRQRENPLSARSLERSGEAKKRAEDCDR